jgi:hypothetical protein
LKPFNKDQSSHITGDEYFSTAGSVVLASTPKIKVQHFLSIIPIPSGSEESVFAPLVEPAPTNKMSHYRFFQSIDNSAI